MCLNRRHEGVESVSKKRRRVPIPRQQAATVVQPQRRRNVHLLLIIVVLVIFLVSAFLFANTSQKPSATAKSPSPRSSLPVFSDLIMMPEDELAKQDIALLNLRAAEGLPGSERLDVSSTLRDLDAWANRVRVETERNFHQFIKNPNEFQHSEAYFRMLLLITVLQQDFGVHYNQARVKDVDFTKSEDLFIHGMIGSKNGGTCVSMPALYTAVARRLGYPVFLVNAKEHVFCRWDGRGERVNIEGTNQGMNSFEDKHYMSWPHPISQDEVDRGTYLKSLSVSESFALFLASRGHCLEDNGNRPDAGVCYSLAVRHSPTNPNYRIFLRRLVKPKTMEDFPGMLAEQEALQRKIRAPFGIANQNQFGNPTVQTGPFGIDPFGNSMQPTQPNPFSTFPNGVPGR